MSDWAQRALAAEKTVEVLKDQVQRLYNGEQLAIQRQLGRATERAQAASQRQILTALRNQELEQYSERLAREVAHKTMELQRILDNVVTGFLVLDRSGTVCGDFTASCKRLVSPHTSEGVRFSELLGLEVMPTFEFEFALDQLFDDILPEELCLAQIPARFERPDGRVLKVDGRVLRGRDGEIEGVLLTINDISMLEAAQRESALNKLLLDLLNDRDAFMGLLQDVQQQLTAGHEAIRRNEKTVVRRIVHTIKGNTASFGLGWLALQIHDMEACAVLTHAHMDTIEQELRAFLNTHYDILQINYEGIETEHIAISSTKLDYLLTLSNGLAEHQAEELEAWVEQILRRPARTLLGPVEKLVVSLATRLEKEVAFQIIGAELCVDHRTLRPLFRNLVHLLKNALDHGMELPGERLELGKPQSGLLRLEIAQDHHDLMITIQDDGRGLDAQRLRDLARERGLITDEVHAVLTDEQSYALIFRDDFSTASEVTDISGRGVGLAAVNAIVKKLGGEIFISSSRGQGTTFRVIVPHSMAALGGNHVDHSEISEARLSR